jgi:hypothetical protein
MVMATTAIDPAISPKTPFTPNSIPPTRQLYKDLCAARNNEG